MSSEPDFSITVDQNKYVPVGAQKIHAIVTAEARGGAAQRTASRAETAEVVIVDTSGSMSMPSTKLSEAKRAAMAAVDTIRDGVYFGIVFGTHEAGLAYPREGRLAPASAHTRSEAKSAIDRLQASGGTAMGQWLRLANRLLSAHPNAIRHAILLTDGENQHETPEELAANLEACSGNFVADCRGVGTDWVVSELRTIASALLGSIDIIARPEEMEDDFRAMMHAAMGKEVADVALRLQAPQTATIKFVKQVSPSLDDLTDKCSRPAAHISDYPTGAWGEEVREYHICVEVPAGPVGREMRAARVMLVLPGRGPDDAQMLASGNILAAWTDDEAQSTRINRRVAHYTGQEELADAVAEGLAARKDGDTDTATARLGRARKLAEETGNDEVAKALDKVVDVVDLESGTVRLKRHVDKADEMTLDTRSTRTVRTRPDAPKA